MENRKNGKNDEQFANDAQFNDINGDIISVFDVSTKEKQTFGQNQRNLISFDVPMGDATVDMVANSMFMQIDFYAIPLGSA